MAISACTPQSVKTTEYKQVSQSAKERALETKDTLWINRYLTLFNQDSFSFKGRLSIKQGRKALTANVKAAIKGDNIVIDISGPLSLGRVRLIVNESKHIYSLLTAKGILNATSLASLSQQAFQITPPLAPLLSWLRGIPQDKLVDDLIINDKGEAVSFIEQGYRVNLKEYTHYNNDHAIEMTLPKKIKVENGNVTVKLVIDHFFIPQ